VAARKEKKQENLEKILKLTKEKGQITHKLVETELKISESNTTNYLNELVSQGKLIAEGETSNRIFKSKLP